MKHICSCVHFSRFFKRYYSNKAKQFPKIGTLLSFFLTTFLAILRQMIISFRNLFETYFKTSNVWHFNLVFTFLELWSNRKSVICTALCYPLATQMEQVGSRWSGSWKKMSHSLQECNIQTLGGCEEAVLRVAGEKYRDDGTEAV